MTTIAQEIADLQAFHLTIAGVETAPADGRPATVPNANRPAILLRPGAGAIVRQARGMTLQAGFNADPADPGPPMRAQRLQAWSR